MEPACQSCFSGPSSHHPPQRRQRRRQARSLQTRFESIVRHAERWVVRPKGGSSCREVHERTQGFKAECVWQRQARGRTVGLWHARRTLADARKAADLLLAHVHFAHARVVVAADASFADRVTDLVAQDRAGDDAQALDRRSRYYTRFIVEPKPALPPTSATSNQSQKPSIH